MDANNSGGIITNRAIHCGNCQATLEVNDTYIRVLAVPPPCNICAFSDWWTEDNQQVKWGNHGH